MAAGPFVVFQQAMLKIAQGVIDFDADSHQAMLLTDGYTPNLVTNAFVSDIVANEAPATGGYVRIAVPTPTVTDAAGNSKFDCGDLDFGNSVTISAKWAVIFRQVGADTVNEVEFVCDLNQGGGMLSSTAANFDVAISAYGLHQILPNQ